MSDPFEGLPPLRDDYLTKKPWGEGLLVVEEHRQRKGWMRRHGPYDNHADADRRMAELAKARPNLIIWPRSLTRRPS